MNESFNFEPVKSFFLQHIQSYGASPLGVGWNSESAQTIRFDQLLKIIETPSFSLLDYGCGYGALVDYLAHKGYEVDYYGFDILETALEAAQQAHLNQPRCSFLREKSQIPVCDYALASGLFNFQAGYSSEAWTELILRELDFLNQVSRQGFASNFLTKYSDPERMRPELYYADPLFLFDYCKRNFSKKVALLHDYELYDFTILVRKS